MQSLMILLALRLLSQSQGPEAQGTPPQAARPAAVFRTEVVVTAERSSVPRDETAASSAILTAERIQQLPAKSLGEALRYMPGFFVLSGHEFGAPAMVQSRGFFGGGEAEYVQLLVDGTAAHDSETGVADWQRFRSWDIERVEARRGPSSSLYGDGALGGVIQIFTRRSPARGGGSLSAGSFSSFAVDAGLSRPAGPGVISVSGTGTRSDSFRRSMGSEMLGGMMTADQAGERNWRFVLSGDRRYREEPGPLDAEQLRRDRAAADPLFDADDEQTARGRLAVSFSKATDSIGLAASAYLAFRESDRARTLLLAPGFGTFARRHLSTRAQGMSAQIEKLNPTFGSRLGLEASGDHVRSEYEDLAAPPDLPIRGGRTRIGAYLSQTWRPWERLHLSGGLRWDRVIDTRAKVRANNQAWSPRAGGTYELTATATSSTTVFAQAEKTFKAPTIDQLFDDRPFPSPEGGTFIISNPSLKPQRAINFEGGIRHARERARLEILVYQMQVEDEIDFDPLTFTYANIGRTRHAGLEIDGQWRQGSRVSTSLTYSWTRVTSLPIRNGHQLKNIPRHLLRPALTIRLPGDGSLAAIYTRATSAYADDQNRVPLGSRSIVDVRVMKRFGRVVGSVDLFNVGNDRYEEVGFVLPDFQGGTVPYFYPGPGLAARAGIEVRF